MNRWLYYFDCDGSERKLDECKIRSVRSNRDTCVGVMNVKCYNKTGQLYENKNQISLPLSLILALYNTMVNIATVQCIVLTDIMKHILHGRNEHINAFIAKA